MDEKSKIAFFRRGFPIPSGCGYNEAGIGPGEALRRQPVATFCGVPRAAWHVLNLISVVDLTELQRKTHFRSTARPDRSQVACLPWKV
jgi:hypothetical protein